MREPFEIDSKDVIVIDDHCVFDEVIIEKLAKILEQKDISSDVLKMLSIDDREHLNKRKKYELIIVIHKEATIVVQVAIEDLNRESIAFQNAKTFL